MKLKYKSVFIIPINSTKNLTDTGWTFESENFIPDFVVELLKNNLKLNLDESYLGVDSYSNESYQVVVSFSSQDKIESVHIKFYGRSVSELLLELNKYEICNYAEVFVPSQLGQ